MTLHLGILARGHHEWKRTDGKGQVTHWIYPEATKFSNPASKAKLDWEDDDSYYQETGLRLWKIFREEPELLEDGIVILYQCGVKGANNGARDAIVNEGLEHFCAVYNEDTGEYELQAKGTAPYKHPTKIGTLRNEITARRIGPFSGLTKTSQAGFN